MRRKKMTEKNKSSKQHIYISNPKEEFNKGFRPTKLTIDISNPPKGGSGLKPQSSKDNLSPPPPPKKK